ncbi:FAD/NAD(P)-binding protein [Trujillonella endophytica]|uniref:FAD-NAD(P)-binding n=1 Tax=Trujillonella endophytica TaxID=673521 RepID=A0A1H8PWT4_9ACTN|nr:FAD/NAD(P)-binding protein [Trujillella endophytica]SEO46410.1 FAD-NAD(P)-binding [Trujillella endophytica]
MPRTSPTPLRPGPVLCVVGAGPTAVGVLERLAANAAELAGADRLTVHLVDPHPPGGGRVWRAAQPALLWANSLVADVTLLPDASVAAEGPVVADTTLAQWIEQVGRALPGALGEEARRLTPTSFPSRPMINAYLSWVLDGVVDRLEPWADVVCHTGRAVDVRSGPDGADVVLADGTVLAADVVLLAQGHLEAGPTAQERALAAAAAEHGLTYLPTGYTADVDLESLAPGEDVLVRGAGLAFVDLAVLLTAGRGGRFERRGDGRLHYVPSGREPVLHVGSRRGVPYRAKLGYTWAGPPVPLRFLTPAAVEEAFGPTRLLDLRADLGPLLARELAWAHYAELFRAAPERTRLPWSEFAERFAAADPAQARELAAAAVPDPADRFDLDALDRPLAGCRFPDPGQLQEAVREHVRADLARSADSRHSSDAAVFVALLQSFGTVGALLAAGRLTPESESEQLTGWFMNLFSYLASGPPGPRLEELLALSEAGVLRFLGADSQVVLDERAGVFRARSASCRGETTARALVDARLPAADVAATRDPLVSALLRRGDARERVLADPSAPAGARRTGRLEVDAELRVLRASGLPDARVLAHGAWTSGPQVAGFARPRTNAPFFRINDALARRLWRRFPAVAGRPVAAEVA